VAGLLVAQPDLAAADPPVNARAHLCWSSSVFLFVVYLVFALRWTFESHLGPASTVGGVLLWVLEVFAAWLSCAYLWEICDALGHRGLCGADHPVPRCTPVAERELPFVSCNVPRAHNEPPDMVIETLRHLTPADIRATRSSLIDRQTPDDETLWPPGRGMVRPARRQVRPLEDWARLQVPAR